MPGQWKEVVRLSFKGARFHDRALDLTALAMLSQFQKMVSDTANALWRRSNPDRERLPKHFEDRTRLCLRSIEDGSAITPLEVFIEEDTQGELWEKEPEELKEAIDLTHEVFEAVEKDQLLPDHFPKHLVDEYAKWGEELGEDEEIEMRPPGKKPARITVQSSKRLASFSEATYKDSVEVTGEVLEADVKHGRFELWLDSSTDVKVNFSPEQEAEVTTALKEHKSRRMKVKGRGELSSQGTLLRITEVSEMQITPVVEVTFDYSARPIEEILQEMAKEVPQEDWDKLPNDLTENLDHYLYGTPKR